MTDTDQILGWKSMRFLFGAGESLIAESELVERGAVEVTQNEDCVCKHDRCGAGCYVATCDYERLDQQ